MKIIPLLILVLLSFSVSFAEEDPFANVPEPTSAADDSNSLVEEDPFANTPEPTTVAVSNTVEEDPFANVPEPVVEVKTPKEVPTTNEVPSSSNPFLIMSLLGILGALVIGFIIFKVYSNNKTE